MKKLILITTGVVLFSAASFAQQDTVKQDKTQQTPTQTQPSQQLRDNDELKGWVRVESSNVPASLRTTLSGDNKYKGWETGTVYTNASGDAYALRTMDKNNPKTYYFDKNGKMTQKPPHN